MQKLLEFSSAHFAISMAFKVAIFAKDALRREPYPTLKRFQIDSHWLLIGANQILDLNHQFENLPNAFGAW